MSTTNPQQVGYGCADLLYDHHSTPIFTYAYWLVGNRERASELVQQTFLEAFRTLPNTGMPRASYLSLLRIATRMALAAPDEGPVACPAYQDLAQEAICETADILQTDDWAALGNLPVQYRAVLLLTVQEKLSYDEIAQVLALSPDDVMGNLAQARLAFRAALRGETNNTPTRGYSPR